MLSNIARRCIIRQNTENKIVVAYFQRKNHSNSNAKIIRSRLPDLSFPNMFVEEVIFENLPKWENRIAVECATTGRNYSYLDLYRKSKALSNALHRIPTLKQNNTIAILLPNVPEYPIVVLGAAQAGLKITTVNPLYTIGEIARQLKDSGARMIFTLGELWTKLDQAIKTMPNQEFTTVVVNHTLNYTPSGTINFNDLLNEDHNLSFKINRSQDDVLALPYSSGTTGLPKGVEITNRNITSLLMRTDMPELRYLLEEGDIVPALIPMFHIYGMVTVTLNTLMRGVKLITMPTFDPQLFIDVLEKHHPTFTFVVPPLVLLMINHPGITPEHLNRLKTVFCGAAPLGAADIERLQEKSKKDLCVLQGYGLTETTGGLSVQTEKLPKGVKYGGAGLCMRNTEVKVVSLDDTNKILGANEVGEIVIRGPQVMKGYHNNLKETQEALCGDGWFRTGDIGYYDEDEHIFVTDRLKELIKVKGFQVAPAELEEIIRDFPNVTEAAVVGIPHDIFGEVPKAFVVLRKGSKVDPEKIQAYVKEKVAKHKQLLGGVTIVDNIPKNAAGKILKRSLC